jgi:hypothetical protein
MAQAITYKTGTSRSALRTVIVDDVRESVVLLPAGRLDVVHAKLLHGTSCRHAWWAEVLGTDPDSDDFIVPAEQIVQRREMNIAVKARHHK